MRGAILINFCLLEVLETFMRLSSVVQGIRRLFSNIFTWLKFLGQLQNLLLSHFDFSLTCWDRSHHRFFIFISVNSSSSCRNNLWHGLGRFLSLFLVWRLWLCQSDRLMFVHQVLCCFLNHFIRFYFGWVWLLAFKLILEWNLLSKIRLLTFHRINLPLQFCFFLLTINWASLLSQCPLVVHHRDSFVEAGRVSLHQSVSNLQIALNFRFNILKSFWGIVFCLLCFCWSKGNQTIFVYIFTILIDVGHAIEFFGRFLTLSHPHSVAFDPGVWTLIGRIEHGRWLASRTFIGGPRSGLHNY